MKSFKEFLLERSAPISAQQHKKLDDVASDALSYIVGNQLNLEAFEKFLGENYDPNDVFTNILQYTPPHEFYDACINAGANINNLTDEEVISAYFDYGDHDILNYLIDTGYTNHHKDDLIYGAILDDHIGGSYEVFPNEIRFVNILLKNNCIITEEVLTLLWEVIEEFNEQLTNLLKDNKNAILLYTPDFEQEVLSNFENLSDDKGLRLKLIQKFYPGLYAILTEKD